MSELLELKRTIDGIQTALSEAQKLNEKRVKELVEENRTDPVLKESIDKHTALIKELMDERKALKESIVSAKEITDRLDQVEVAIKRPSGLYEQTVPVREMPEYKAFEAFCRKGVDRLTPEQKGLILSDDTDGGIWAPPQVINVVESIVYQTSPIRQYAEVISTGGGLVRWPYDIDEAGSGGWIGEQETRDETTTPTVGLQTMEIHEAYAKPWATEQMLEDAQFDIVNWLLNKVRDKLLRAENSAFISGDGQKKPRGLTTYPAWSGTSAASNWGKIQQVTTANKGVFDADDLVNLRQSVKKENRTGAGVLYFVSTDAMTQCMLLKFNDGRYAWIPSTREGEPDRLFGYPVEEFADMDSVASGNIPIGFGSLRNGYRIVDRVGFTVRRLDQTPPKIYFYARKRVGGDVKNFDAFKLLKIKS